jgi:hypothetical protein
VRSLANQSGKPMGRVVSELLAKALAPQDGPETRNGLPVFPRVRDAPPATMELVNRLRDGEDA